MPTIVTTTAAPAAVGPYAQGVSAAGLVFCSGQLPIDPETGTVPEGVAPARSTVEVARLPRDVLVEVEAIALIDARQG